MKRRNAEEIAELAWDIYKSTHDQMPFMSKLAETLLRAFSQTMAVSLAHQENRLLDALEAAYPKSPLDSACANALSYYANRPCSHAGCGPGDACSCGHRLPTYEDYRRSVTIPADMVRHDAQPPAKGTIEAPCTTCGRPNDVGVAVCWNCGGKPQP
jgi:hypothetical protein